MSDLISRQAAIDALDKHIDTFDAIDTNYLCGLRTAMSILKEMPSAQPETHDKCTETHACDLIGRQEAIDAICKACSLSGDYQKCDGYPEESTWCEELVALRALPSAQTHWIPCSERLPKYPYRVQIQLDNGWIITGYYSEEHWYTVPHCGGFLRNDEVEAWRELPEPYEGSDAK